MPQHKPVGAVSCNATTELAKITPVTPPTVNKNETPNANKADVFN